MAVKMYQGGSVEFLRACGKATKALGNKIEPTKRQYRKWTEKRGSAWNHRHLPDET